MLRPLPSWNRGVGFRSRLEARWSRFLDTMGIPWEYEPQGYNLGDDTRYLADFWLPSLDVYAEVKPHGVPLDIAVAKCRALARGKGKRVVLLVGAPGENTYYANVYGDHDGDRLLMENGVFAECPRCDGIGIVGECGWVEIGQHACRERAKPLHTPSASPRIFGAYIAAQNGEYDKRTGA